MTDNDILADNNIKHFGKLSSNQVSCYQYPTDIDSESIPSCSDRVCLECGNDHSFRGNFKDTITSIDILAQMFPALFKDSNESNCRAISKLQEFVN
jgi:hypothetical protein